MASFSTIVLLVLSDGLRFSGRYVSYEDFYRYKFGLSDGSIRVTMNRLYDRGFVQKMRRNGKAYFGLTSVGILRLQHLFFPAKREKWDGKWRVIILTKDEDIKEYIVGKLQNGIYVSPFPVGENNEAKLIFETKRLGFLRHRQAGEKVWKLVRLESRLNAWIAQVNAARGSKNEFTSLVFRYEQLITDMPRLPVEILPASWPEDKARKTARKLVEKYFRGH